MLANTPPGPPLALEDTRSATSARWLLGKRARCASHRMPCGPAEHGWSHMGFGLQHWNRLFAGPRTWSRKTLLAVTKTCAFAVQHLPQASHTPRHGPGCIAEASRRWSLVWAGTSSAKAGTSSKAFPTRSKSVLTGAYDLLTQTEKHSTAVLQPHLACPRPSDEQQRSAPVAHICVDDGILVLIRNKWQFGRSDGFVSSRCVAYHRGRQVEEIRVQGVEPAQHRAYLLTGEPSRHPDQSTTAKNQSRTTVGCAGASDAAAKLT